MADEQATFDLATARRIVAAVRLVERWAKRGEQSPGPAAVRAAAAALGPFLASLNQRVIDPTGTNEDRWGWQEVGGDRRGGWSSDSNHSGGKPTFAGPAYPLAATLNGATYSGDGQPALMVWDHSRQVYTFCPLAESILCVPVDGSAMTRPAGLSALAVEPGDNGGCYVEQVHPVNFSYYNRSLTRDNDGKYTPLVVYPSAMQQHHHAAVSADVAQVNEPIWFLSGTEGTYDPKYAILAHRVINPYGGHWWVSDHIAHRLAAVVDGTISAGQTYTADVTYATGKTRSRTIVRFGGQASGGGAGAFTPAATTGDATEVISIGNASTYVELWPVRI